jgi:hypothetical protein
MIKGFQKELSTMEKFHYLLLFAIILNISCREEMPQQVQTIDEVKKQIVGGWLWKKTVIVKRGLEPKVTTPEDERKSVIYFFSEDGIFTILENGNSILDSEYEIITNGSAEKSNVEFKLFIKETAGVLILYFENGTLILSDGMGASRYFIRQ